MHACACMYILSLSFTIHSNICSLCCMLIRKGQTGTLSIDIQVRLHIALPSRLYLFDMQWVHMWNEWICTMSADISWVKTYNECLSIMSTGRIEWVQAVYNECRQCAMSAGSVQWVQCTMSAVCNQCRQCAECWFYKIVVPLLILYGSFSDWMWLGYLYLMSSTRNFTSG